MTLFGRRIATIIGIALGWLGVASAEVQGQAASLKDPVVVELLRKIEQRDAAIRDLQRRVSELEGRRATAASVTAAKPRKARPEVPAQTRPESSVATAQPRKRVRMAAPPAPPSAPGQFEVDQEAAERALERTLVRTGALLIPTGMMEVQSSIAFTRWELEGQRAINVGNDLVIADEDIRRNIFDADVGLRFGLPYDSQFEVTIPYRWVAESTVNRVLDTKVSDSASGFGDIRLGWAKTLVREKGWRPDIVGRVIWDTDTGSTSDTVDVALGDGFDSVSLALSAVKRQDPLAFIGGLSYQKTFEENDLEPGDQFGLSLGAVLAASPETSLRFVFAQTLVDERRVNGRKVVGSDLVQGNLTIGASTIVGRGTLLDVSTNIGVTDDAPDYTLGLSLNKRFSLW